MKFENHMTVTFPSRSANEAFARSVVACFAAQMDPTLEELGDIRTAVSEAVTNSIVHGYKNRCGVIYLNAEIIENELTVEITDKGCGISNIEEARQPLFTSQPEMERSGMGFTVMETFMDSLDVVSNVGAGTKIIMRKMIGNYE